MGLPFMQPKKISTVIISRRKGKDTEVKPEVMGPGMDEDDGLMAASEDLMRAIEEKSATGIASALRSAFEICDSEPHVEGEHVEDDAV